MKILVTGSAGFIGSALTLKLLSLGKFVVGIDNHNKYYDPKLKEARVNRYINNKKYQHYKIDLTNKRKLEEVFNLIKPKIVINLAAQAGVQYSMKNPSAYIKSNIVGFSNILESCVKNKVNHLVYASTSSVYGANTKKPYSEHDSANHPLSIYSASKKSNELMAHAYSHIYNLPTTGLRFFTVYGPWGRPDMALFKFTKSILENKNINVFNYGKHTRDFTYIDDIVEGILKVLNFVPKSNKKWNSKKPDPATSIDPWRIFNIGNNNPVPLGDYIQAVENVLKKKAKINYLPLQVGDVPDTFADISDLTKFLNYKPKTKISSGVRKFVNWYTDYYNVKIKN